jgi:hypothetical protein
MQRPVLRGQHCVVSDVAADHVLESVGAVALTRGAMHQVFAFELGDVFLQALSTPVLRAYVVKFGERK